MLDLKLIREESSAIKAMLRKRGLSVDIDTLLTLDKERTGLIGEIERLRAERNTLSKSPSKDNAERAKFIKTSLKDLEPKLESLEGSLRELHLTVPNLLHPDVPEGPNDSANVEIRRWGKPRSGPFYKGHDEVGVRLGLLDLERGAKISGSGFYFLTNAAVLLEFALVQYAMKTLMQAGFRPVITPELVRSHYASCTGYLPKREEPDIYKLCDEDLFLVATAEIPLAAMHANETFDHADLPRKYVGFSSCFRREAGAHGKHKKGIFRVHQFDKVEMFCLTTPEKSMEQFHEFIGLSEKLLQGLDIPYRVCNICSGDMNGPGYIKYDLEYFSPVDNCYREITSGTNTTDYQSRRLNIRFKRDGKLDFVHTLNNTAIPMSRALIAIIENYQNEDGSITVPEVLRSYMGIDRIA